MFLRLPFSALSTAVAHPTGHTLYQSFAVYLLTLSAKVCFNGNSEFLVFLN